MKDMLGKVRFTSPDRIVYPRARLTKLDVANYYIQVAPWMLPHVVMRPVSAVRCPKGCGDPDNPCFYQKKEMRGLNEAVLRVQAPTQTGTSTQLAIQDADGLVALVQFGCLEFHVWGARYDSPHNPDRMIIDLDPHPDLKWSRVVTSAFWIRKELQKLGLESFVKTTGGLGLHIIIPLMRRNTWDQVQQVSTGLSQRLVTAAPTQFTLNMAKSARKGKILLDCLRNTLGATAVAPYSTRAREGATVATPISWKELESLPRGAFTIATVLERLRQFARGEDPWSEMASVRQSLTKAIINKTK